MKNDALPSDYLLFAVVMAIAIWVLTTIVRRRKCLQLPGLQMALNTLLVTCGASPMGFFVGFTLSTMLYTWQGWTISPTQRLDDLTAGFVATVFLIDAVFVTLLANWFLSLQFLSIGRSSGWPDARQQPDTSAVSGPKKRPSSRSIGTADGFFYCQVLKK